MHHAAMANKKEMMFTLARLGCDWRARAEGIDGATAAFVLCGQHTRTTRQTVRFTHFLPLHNVPLPQRRTSPCQSDVQFCYQSVCKLSSRSIKDAEAWV